ncbi:MAG: aldo/keto reductase [Proteobacteria bacterium]|nr:aldo/keto reductase [Pseudomonadota bacterium]
MEYRRLGNSGLMISALSYGSWLTFDAKSAEVQKQCMHAAYDAGVNFFDNAEVYAGGESETVMGDILAKAGWERDSYIISSKVFWGGNKPTQKGLSRKHIVDACNAALKRLRVDYIDLYFCHRPDAGTPVEETVRTMNNLIDQGKILYWGTSEWPADLITQAHAVAKENRLVGPTMEQPQYNMIHRERMEKEYLRLFKHFGMGTTIWSPLASGILTGKYLNGIPEGSRFSKQGMEWLKDIYLNENVDSLNRKVLKLQKLSQELGMSLPQLGICWCMENSNVSTVILGASRTEQLTETLKAESLRIKLNKDVLTQIDLILENVPAPERIF